MVAAVSGASAGSSAPDSMQPHRGGKAPLLGTKVPGAIKGRYIVVFDKSVSGKSLKSAGRNVQAQGGQIHYRYNSAIKGFAATLSKQQVESLRKDSRVSFIEADHRIRLSATQSPATWGLDRIDQRALPLSNSYTYNVTGAGVKAYIIDTGMRLTHNEFGGRAVSGYDAIDGGSADDCNGHGTHVAGTVGGSTYGVAKGVSLVAVRVLNCAGSGTNSQVIAGINWVTSDHAAGQPAVANMSLGGGASSAIDTAVSNSIADGVTYAVAAGNDNANACNGSPSRVASAITVGSTTSTDARSSFSNYGTCLDIFAPGSSITSSWYTSNTATNTISGTSMATPHVTGVAALALQASPGASPATVTNTIVSTATTNVVGSPGSGSPNRLLYSLLSANPNPDPTPTPTPTNPPTSCSGTTYTGSLSGTGDYDIHPNGNYFQTTTSGTHNGCLVGPAGVDFDLYLYRWNGYSWSLVAQGIGSTATETVTYSGSAGYYYWEVDSYTGSGSYTFTLQRPN
ncbi:MAG: S8 family serine peptidase [Actinobacteria bacterium]|nr:S8 family serine peptidase [Actinomycetota bacterium]